MKIPGLRHASTPSFDFERRPSSEKNSRTQENKNKNRMQCLAATADIWIPRLANAVAVGVSVLHICLEQLLLYARKSGEKIRRYHAPIKLSNRYRFDCLVHVRDRKNSAFYVHGPASGSPPRSPQALGRLPHLRTVCGSRTNTIRGHT